MGLIAPNIPTAVDGKLGYFEVKNGIKIVIPKYENALHGEIITLMWGSEYFVEKIIDSVDESFPVIFNVSDNFPLSCLYDGSYDISYTTISEAGNPRVSDIYKLTIATRC